MRFQRDNDSAPEYFDAGLPRAESGNDVPRWLVILGAVAGLALLVALVRYAIDLLGVVFVIILVGFAIRALSDWFTEGEAVSGWAMSALSLGLTGTVLVALWLSNSRDLTGGGLGSRLPGPVQRTVSWLEERGWGQRVLLPGHAGAGSGGSGRLGAAVGGATGTSAPEPPAVGGISKPVLRPIPESAPSAACNRSGRARGGTGGAGSTESDAAASQAASPSSATTPAPVATRLRLTAPAASVVGLSVRLVAEIDATGSPQPPTGRVVFYTGGVEIGRATVRGRTAVLSTLALELGEHELSASYEGDERHLASASASIGHTVRRQ
jgi:hypothetical protein